MRCTALAIASVVMPKKSEPAWVISLAVYLKSWADARAGGASAALAGRMLSKLPVAAGTVPSATKPVINFLRSISRLPFLGRFPHLLGNASTAWNLYGDWGFFAGEMRLESESADERPGKRREYAAFRRRL